MGFSQIGEGPPKKRVKLCIGFAIEGKGVAFLKERINVLWFHLLKDILHVSLSKCLCKPLFGGDYQYVVGFANQKVAVV